MAERKEEKLGPRVAIPAELRDKPAHSWVREFLAEKTKKAVEESNKAYARVKIRPWMKYALGRILARCDKMVNALSARAERAKKRMRAFLAKEGVDTFATGGPAVYEVVPQVSVFVLTKEVEKALSGEQLAEITSQVTVISPEKLLEAIRKGAISEAMGLKLMHVENATPRVSLKTPKVTK
ncbi:MAG: hypothetical protein HYT39_00895 [Candidatus Sungbacteria bacterium]|nr:hypothetical protein [Candidatus Sungbacteria bacterium]